MCRGCVICLVVVVVGSWMLCCACSHIASARARRPARPPRPPSQVEALTQQLAALQALQARNRMLEGMNGELQAQLLTREKEVERLRAAIDTVADGGVHPDSPEAAAEAAARLCADAGCVPCEVQPQDLKGALRGVCVCGWGHALRLGLCGCALPFTVPRRAMTVATAAPTSAAGIDFRQGFKEQIERLQQFLEQHELIDSSGGQAARG